MPNRFQSIHGRSTLPITSAQAWISLASRVWCSSWPFPAALPSKDGESLQLGEYMLERDLGVVLLNDPDDLRSVRILAVDGARPAQGVHRRLRGGIRPDEIAGQ